MPNPAAVVVALAAGALIGAVNAFFILYFRIHSLIVTLGVGYFVNGVVLWVSNSAVVFGQSLSPLVTVVFPTKLFGVALLFWYALILTIAALVSCSSTPPRAGGCCSSDAGARWRGCRA